jgi:MoaA/NifB/PqqE/SkfB family radical SAM enzyme
MRANNLTISIPNKGCDKSCPYCVSKCTGAIKENRGLMLSNLPKVLTMARLGQVSSVMLTGKGEPCLNFKDVLMFCEHFREFPLEIQTNGIWLSHHLLEVPVLAGHGMNVVAISIDDSGSVPIEKLSKAIHDAGMLLRMTFNVTNAFKFREFSFQSLLDYCVKWGVDQLTLRKIVAPNYTEETEQSIWIKDKVDDRGNQSN